MTNEELANRIKNGETELTVDLWENIKKYIYLRANKHFSNTKGQDGNEIEDFIQCGFLAMIEAIKYFDIESGFTFISFLNKCLKTEFAIAGNYRTSRIEPLNFSTSLDAPTNEKDDDLTLLDTIEDERNDFEKTEDTIWNNQLHEVLEKALNELETEEKEIIKLRYYKAKTGEETAKLLNNEKIEVYLKEKKALNKLRRNKYKTGLDQFLEINTNFFLHTGIKGFTDNHTSDVEKIVFNREKLIKEYWENQNE